MGILVNAGPFPAAVVVGIPFVVGCLLFLALIALRLRQSFPGAARKSWMKRLTVPVFLAVLVGSSMTSLSFGLAASGVEKETLDVRSSRSLDCIFVFDVSGSMPNTQLHDTFLVRLVEQMNMHAKDARCSTVIFADKSVEAAVLTSDHFLILQAIGLARDQLGAGTYISQGIRHAQRIWEREGRPRPIEIFVVSDLLDGKPGEFKEPMQKLLAQDIKLTVFWFSQAARSYIHRQHVEAAVVVLQTAGARILEIQDERDIEQVVIVAGTGQTNTMQRFTLDRSGQIPAALLLSAGLFSVALMIVFIPWVRWR